jgi:hypothetical protein
MFDSITNRAEFFSDHYLNARLAADLGDLRSAWDAAEGKGEPTARTGLRSAAKAFFPARAAAVEAARGSRTATGRERRVETTRALNDVVLGALGFGHSPDEGRRTLELPRAGGTDTLTVELAASVETPTGLLLVALDCGIATDVDELFDAEPFQDSGEHGDAGLLLAPLQREAGKHVVFAAADAPGELFSLDEAPRFVLLCAGTVVLLAERSKWAEGRFLAVDLDAALERLDTKARGELETIAALFSADALIPGRLGGDDQATSVLDQLTEASQKHAIGVSKELRDGMRLSVEILANEVIEQRLAESRRRHDVRFAGDQVDARELTTQCLRYLYRLIVLLYAESRPELGVLPVDDDAYLAGYSVDRLRELVLADLTDDHARNGSHFQDSLDLLFRLVNEGYHSDNAQLNLLAATELSHEDYLEFPGLDATIFDPSATPLLNGVTLRNEALRKVLHLLMVSPGRRRDDQAGFISYAELGINQLGAVYEGLMAYTGFFATEDLYEVAKGGDPSDGTWMVPVTDADGYPPEVFVTRTDPDTGVTDRVRHPKGSFVYRLAGRDRQRSASYYTPEVLTQCVVRHALAELLGTDDHARVPGGSAGVTKATEILDLTICEPALGSGAFANEAINQLSAEYLKRCQAELGETLDAEAYQRELQKVKAHFALHQVYGVDLNATAVELAEVSLWLNCMHPGLKAPWFGLRLRRGNSLIGARRATWRTSQLKDRVWAREKSTAKAPVAPPVDRPLAEPLDADEVHHFLLPGHGWGAVSTRKEAKELAPDAAKALAEWRKAILKAPSAVDTERLTALAAGVERLWAEATDVLSRLHERMHRPLGLYGTDEGGVHPEDDRRTAEQILTNPDSALGRLRLVMDAWVALWFWPLDTDRDFDGTSGEPGAPADGDTAAAHLTTSRKTAGDDLALAPADASSRAWVRPPNWSEWLTVLEELVGAEPTEPTGQLDLFADLDALAEVEARRAAKRSSVETLQRRHQWLARAEQIAGAEGAWHWELELAPVFHRGGFDLQVGNPPWVRLDWRDDLTLAEFDPWWGITEKPPESNRKHRRSSNLERALGRAAYLSEVASHAGLTESLSSPQSLPALSGIRTNLYMVFMTTVWRHAATWGVSGLLHPESHFIDPDAARLREETYSRLRRHWQFNELGRWFAEVPSPTATFGATVMGSPDRPAFLQISNVQAIEQIDGSLVHDGSGDSPGLALPNGSRDVRPHADRVLLVDEEILGAWARLFDAPRTPATQARLLRPVTRQDLTALSTLADQPSRLADQRYHWTSGWNETNAKADGYIRWLTEVPATWDAVVLQGPHFTVATPFAKQPNENCSSKSDYSDWDLESLPERTIPRTNYQRACDPQTYDANVAYWDGTDARDLYRVAWRKMTQPTPERSLHVCLLHTGPTHAEGIRTLAFDSSIETVTLAGLWATLPFDYLVRVVAATNLTISVMERTPLPRESALAPLLALRTLRLNGLTADYKSLWEGTFQPEWMTDSWTQEPGSPWGTVLARMPLGGVESQWSSATPLRRDAERRMALVECDAIAAIMLGLTDEELCAMYRTQFAVLRKYEYAMAFDQEGRKVCQHHHSAGYRQGQLQQEAKDGQRDKQWKSVWQMVLQEEEDPGSVDWEGQFTPPFIRPDREAEMTRAYEVFTRRMHAEP